MFQNIPQYNQNFKNPIKIFFNQKVCSNSTTITAQAACFKWMISLFLSFTYVSFKSYIHFSIVNNCSIVQFQQQYNTIQYDHHLLLKTGSDRLQKTSVPPPLQPNGAASAPTAMKLTPLQLLWNRLRIKDSALTAPGPVFTGCTKKIIFNKVSIGKIHNQLSK